MWTSVHTWHTCQNYFIKKKKKAKHALKPSLISRCLWRRFVIISEMLPFWVPHLPAHINAASLHTSWTRGSFINVSLWTHYAFYLQCPWASFFVALKIPGHFLSPGPVDSSLMKLPYFLCSMSLKITFGISVFSHTYHLTLPLIFSRVLFPPVDCELLKGSTHHFRVPRACNCQYINSRKSLGKWGWLCFVESTPCPVCLAGTPICLVRILRKAGSNP